jgi:hypothetical protein
MKLTPTNSEKRPHGPITGERLRGLNKKSKKPKPKGNKMKSFIQLFKFIIISGVDESLAAMIRSLARLPNDLKKLKKMIYMQNKKILRLQQAAQRKQSRKASPSEAKRISLSYLMDVLKPAQFEFVASQIDNADKKPGGRRYTHKFKTICLGLYIFDPRAYNNLRNLLVCFPAESTLKVFVISEPLCIFEVKRNFSRK